MTAEPQCDEEHFEASVVPADPTTVVVRGPLDFDTADELVETAVRALEAGRERRVLALDLAGVSLCDSMGLSALLTIRRRTAAEGVRLRLVRSTPPLDRLFQLTGTAEYLAGTPEDEHEHSEP